MSQQTCSLSSSSISIFVFALPCHCRKEKGKFFFFFFLSSFPDQGEKNAKQKEQQERKTRKRTNLNLKRDLGKSVLNEQQNVKPIYVPDVCFLPSFLLFFPLFVFFSLEKEPQKNKSVTLFFMILIKGY